VALSAPADATGTRTGARRLPGPDVVRAVALIGVVVMNYHGYLVIQQGDGDTGSGWAAELFDPWTGPLSTRFAATFVLVAGVGVTLMTRGATAALGALQRVSTSDGSWSDAVDRVRQLRWRLVRRGVLLYTGGLVLDEIWPGTIIPFYGAMFVLAAAMFTWRTSAIVAVGVAAASAGWAIRLWRFEQRQDGFSTAWLTDPDEGSVNDFVFGVFVNGTHPLLPWMAFLCAGMVLGRLLTTSWWRPAAIGVGVVLAGTAAVVSSTASTGFESIALSTDPGQRGLLYVASALGTALIAYGIIDGAAERFPLVTDPLRRAGQLSLSLYLLHILVFTAVVDWWGWIEPAGLDVALSFALAFWIVGIAAAVAWHRTWGMGPAERVYRAFGG